MSYALNGTASGDFSLALPPGVGGSIGPPFVQATDPREVKVIIQRLMDRATAGQTLDETQLLFDADGQGPRAYDELMFSHPVVVIPESCPT